MRLRAERAQRRLRARLLERPAAAARARSATTARSRSHGPARRSSRACGLLRGARADVWLREAGMLRVSTAPARTRRSTRRSTRRGSSACRTRRCALGGRARERDPLAALPQRRLLPRRRDHSAGPARARAAAGGARRRRRAARAHARDGTSGAGVVETPRGRVRAQEIVVAINAAAAGWKPLRRAADDLRQLRRADRARARAARGDQLDRRRGDHRRPDVPALLPHDRTTAAC